MAVRNHHSQRRVPRALACACAAIGAAILLAACGGSDDDNAPVSSTSVKDEGKKQLVALEKRLGETGAAAKKAGCTIAAPEQLEANHVNDTANVKFSSEPPTSGEHLNDWAAWGFFDEPVPDGAMVHNLEHGGVGLWYGTNALTIERLALVRDEVLDENEKWIVTPRDELEGIAVGSWGTLMKCPQASIAALDDEALQTLLDTYYEETHSRETDVERNVPAYAGALPEPQPERDISRPTE